MALTVRQTTSFTTQDPGQGGSAVTGGAATGHASTTTAQVGSGSASKTCIWTGLTAVAGTITAITLKVDWIQNGSLSDGGASTSNQFTIDYSLNGGSSWSSLRNATQITASTSGTSSVSLLTSQDLTQVRVRDALIATAVIGESASVTATVSGIRAEVVTADSSGRAVVAVM